MTMSGAQRSALWRERHRQDRVPVAIDLTREMIDTLIDGGFLAEWDDSDKAAIGAALRRYLEQGRSVSIYHP